MFMPLLDVKLTDFHACSGTWLLHAKLQRLLVTKTAALLLLQLRVLVLARIRYTNLVSLRTNKKQALYNAMCSKSTCQTVHLLWCCLCPFIY